MAKKFEVTLLGVNSAFPVNGRHPSCQIVNYDDRLFMIDCGEASQIQVEKYRIRRSKINHIFISHLHGDHVYGLPGLLTSYALQGRKAALNVHGPIGIRPFIEGVFSHSGAIIPYELNITEYDTAKRHRIEVDKCITVETFPMKHRMPTMGFRFVEDIKEWNIDSEAISKYDLSIEEIKTAKKGLDVQRGEEAIPNDKMTLKKAPARSYAYCSDTVYDPDLVAYIEGSSMLYHETTYLDEMADLAAARMHSTLGQAIDIAKAAHIPKLITGHYSSRYSEIEVFRERGLLRFEGLLLGEEGQTYEV